MAKHNEMIRHRVVGIGCLQPIPQLHRFTESGLGEVDMINVGSFAGSCWCGILFTGSRLWRFLSLNECHRQ